MNRPFCGVSKGSNGLELLFLADSGLLAKPGEKRSWNWSRLSVDEAWTKT
jgi:hypothetical protein